MAYQFHVQSYTISFNSSRSSEEVKAILAGAGARVNRSFLLTSGTNPSLETMVYWLVSIRAGGASIKQLAEALDRSPISIRKALHSLKSQGCVEARLTGFKNLQRWYAVDIEEED